MDFPAPLSIFSCYWSDGGKNLFSSLSFSHPNVLKSLLLALDVITASLNKQEQVITRGPYHTRELLSDVPDLGTREKEDFLKSRVQSSYWALFSPQKGTTYDNHPSFVLDRGCLEEWGWLTCPRLTFFNILTCLSFKSQSLIPTVQRYLERWGRWRGICLPPLEGNCFHSSLSASSPPYACLQEHRGSTATCWVFPWCPLVGTWCQGRAPPADFPFTLLDST